MSSSNSKTPAIFLMGPTAAGKSAFAMRLAQELPVEIISVDSAMVYTGMDIGTGKPSAADRAEVPHHLLDIRDPSVAYSAAEFAKDALQAMDVIRSRGKIPLLVGGTLLYFRALEQGLSALPSADPAIRARLLAEGESMGWATMHQRLAAIDPKSAERIHPNDPQRIQRALEVYELTQQPLSALISPASKEAIEPYQIHSFALMPERSVLHQKIEQRFYQMLEQGFMAELEVLFRRGDLNSAMPSMRAVGYRQGWAYLEGTYDQEEMIYRAMVATRQLAKRQSTWLRSLAGVKKLSDTHLASIKSVIHYLSLK